MSEVACTRCGTTNSGPRTVDVGRGESLCRGCATTVAELRDLKRQIDELKTRVSAVSRRNLRFR
jgi:hypothetical protein